MKRTYRQTFDLSDPRWYVPLYIPVFHDKRPRKIIFGSRNSAKSFFAAQYFVNRLLNEPTRLILMRKVYDTIKDSQWQTIKDVVDLYGPELRQHFKFLKSPLSIEVSNGNLVLARGLDKEDKAKSVKDPNCIWFEELDQIEYEAYRSSVLSIRGRGYNEHLATFNAPPEDHWIIEKLIPDYKEWEREDGTHTYVRRDDPKTMILHTNYEMNPHAYRNEAFMEEISIIKRSDNEEYRVQGLGLVGHVRTGDEFFSNFDSSIHLDDTIVGDDRLSYHISFDFNNKPYATCLIFQVIGKNVNQIDEYTPPPPANTIEDIADEFFGRYPGAREAYFYGDPTGKNKNQRKSRLEKLSYLDQIKTSFAPIWHNNANRFVRKAPSLAGRRRAFLQIFGGARGITFRIHPKCRNTITDLQKLRIANEGGYIKKKERDKNGDMVEKYGHCGDALTYFFSYLYKDLF